MGNNASRPAPVDQEKLAERARAMHLEDARPDPESDYVKVEEEPRPSLDSPFLPLKHDVSIATSGEWAKKAMEDPKNRLALAALSTHRPNDVLSSRATKLADVQVFNIKIGNEGSPVTDQHSSGRCWLFASTNIFRLALMRRYELDSFQLSQSYLFFWDKFEKANYFLEQMIDTANKDLDDREVQALLQAPASDGGQWDMVVNLVLKYGLVPHSKYPDSFNAENSSSMNKIIKAKLREDAFALRKACKGSKSASFSVSALKMKMLKEIHLMLTLMLGPPPNPEEQFVWDYQDKNGKCNSVKSTPLGFARAISSADAVRASSETNIGSLFSLVNDPRNEYGKLLTVARLGNVVEGRPVTYVNVSMQAMKKACINMLQAGIPVFFGSDVGQYSDNKSGIMDTALLDFSLAFNVELGMSKSQRLSSNESSMTHAMVLTGVHVVEGKSVRWRVENSWGESVGSKGFFVASDDWMDNFVYQAVVDPRFVPREITDILKDEPIVLPIWDPMGALA